MKDVPLHSTGALTAAQHREQDLIYASNPKYDRADQRAGTAQRG